MRSRKNNIVKATLVAGYVIVLRELNTKGIRAGTNDEIAE